MRALLSALLIASSLVLVASAQERPEKTSILAAERMRNLQLDDWKRFLKSEDPKFVARALVGVARVGHPSFIPLVRDLLENESAWTPDLRQAATLAVALLGEADLLPLLAKRVAAADLARALGGVGRLPSDPEHRKAVLEALDSAPGAEDEVVEGIIRDPFVARLVYGIRVKEPIGQDWAWALLSKKTSVDRYRAAAYYLARHPAKPPARFIQPLSAAVVSSDPLTCSYAARALARTEGAGAEAAIVIAYALEKGKNRDTQLVCLRALAGLPPAPALKVVSAFLSSADPMLRRTALEIVGAWGAKLPVKDRSGLAAFAQVIIDKDPVMDVRRAAVLTLARLAPSTFRKRITRWRLGAPWQIRAAVAEGLHHLPWDDDVLRLLTTYRGDPDRRVSIAALESLDAHVRKSSDVAGDARVLGLIAEVDPKVLKARDRDPVLLGLCAKVAEGVVKGSSRSARLVPLLQSIHESLPSHEVEPLQAVIDLAAALMDQKAARELLVFLSERSHEPSLRQRACSALKIGPPSIKDYDVEISAQAVIIDPLPPKAPRTRVALKTSRGTITLTLFDDEAPVTVGNFLNLARRGYYDGVLFHRVVPSFVAQAGCPRGDGWGSPGYTIPCEISNRTYRRGTLGMALAGKDTGGSQWFLCHTPQPHLDLRYTIFGEVSEGLGVLDALLPGDVILGIDPL